MQFELFTEAQLEKLFQEALQVWKKIPFRVQGTDEFFDYLNSYGCQINGELIRFPQSVIDEVLLRISDEKAINLKTRCHEQPESEIGMFTHGQAFNICDTKTNKIRSVTKDDLAVWCHLVDSLGDVFRCHPTFVPTDVPTSSADFHTFATVLLNSSRPHISAVYSIEMLPLFIEACRIVDAPAFTERRNPVFTGEHYIKHPHVFTTNCYVTSPFLIGRENVQMAMEARRLLGRPLQFVQMDVAGASSPVTIAGSLVQNTAESLGVCAMRLAVDDLTHEIVPTNTTIDMSSLSHRQCGPDMALHAIAGGQMHKYLYGFQPQFYSFAVSAQTVSSQSVYEKAMSAMYNIMRGQRCIGIGSLAHSDVGSPVQLILDYEMGQYFRHLFRGISSDDEHVGIDDILEIAPKGAHFIESMHTASLFGEECWIPQFVDSRPPLAWAQNPTDMIEKAREKTIDLQKSSINLCPLSEDKKKQILDLVKEADKIAQLNEK